MAVGRLLRRHLGHQVSDGAAHVGGAGEGGGGEWVGATGGQVVVVNVLHGVLGVGLAAGHRAHGGALAGGVVLGRAALRFRAGH